MHAVIIFELSSSKIFFLHVLFVSVMFLTVTNVLFKVFLSFGWKNSFILSGNAISIGEVFPIFNFSFKDICVFLTLIISEENQFFVRSWIVSTNFLTWVGIVEKLIPLDDMFIKIPYQHQLWNNGLAF
ncbi:hypothetical protein EP517_02790 [Salmonella enterica]|nr:hypothetical protein [Salmonella enterica]EAR5413184.1 hypothetical protein [Salmonella enterica]